MSSKAWLAAAARAVYVSLPLPTKVKVRLKDDVYTRMGTFFTQSPRYIAWRESRNGGGAAHQPTAPSLNLEAPPADTAPLAVADGRWEWQDYVIVKRRIADAVATRDISRPRRRRTLITLAPAELTQAAGRIRLPKPGAEPDVSIIIPAYGHLKYTIECLLSISAATDTSRSFEVIVADDASPDSTAEVLSGVRHLRLVRQAENVGFLRNCNAAADQAAGRLIVFLNNDTQVTTGWLNAMASVFDEWPNVGAVGPRVVYPDGNLQDAGTRVRREGAIEMIGLNGAPEDPRWGYPRDVDYVSGACLMVVADVFREMGGFDEALAPAYCEDLELGLRLRERGLRSMYTPKAEIVHHLSVTSDAHSADFKTRAITRNMQALAERYQEKLDELDDVRVVTFYLPQFHQFEENDLWWGPGFTEWTNVVQARQNWAGHYQPRVPADLGYYDLRVPESIERQWQLASRYGIDAFCYYYYWFAGKRLLDRPLDRLLSSDQAAHPFCLCWANENWTRRWDGQDDEILIAQRHSAADDLAVIRDLARYMAHPAYLRVRGRALLLVYRVDLFPNFAETAERWRTECGRLGVGEIELVMVESFRFAGESVDPAAYGCDAVVEFPAHHIPGTRDPSGTLFNLTFEGAVADYRDAAVRKAARAHPGYKLYRGVMPGWDNTARRQDAPFVLENATPGAFQAWLETAIEETKRDLQGEDRLVFINAWNEWAEGAYLEPDRRFGHTFLEAIQNARDASRFRGRA